MNRQLSTILFCLACCLPVTLRAQGRGPGGPPPPGGPGMGHAPGMPPGFPPPSRGNNGPPSSGNGASTSGLSNGRPANIPSRTGIKLGPPGRWWDDRAFVQAVGLRREQQKKMDAIFNANKPAIIESYKAFQAEQSKLDALTRSQQVDKTKMFASIDAVNQARSTLEKANTQMLLQIREQLDSAQVSKLDALP